MALSFSSQTSIPGRGGDGLLGFAASRKWQVLRERVTAGTLGEQSVR